MSVEQLIKVQVSPVQQQVNEVEEVGEGEVIEAIMVLPMVVDLPMVEEAIMVVVIATDDEVLAEEIMGDDLAMAFVLSMVAILSILSLHR